MGGKLIKNFSERFSLRGELQKTIYLLSRHTNSRGENAIAKIAELLSSILAYNKFRKKLSILTNFPLNIPKHIFRLILSLKITLYV